LSRLSATRSLLRYPALSPRSMALTTSGTQISSAGDTRF
jgi:hypothetical protein